MDSRPNKSSIAALATAALLAVPAAAGGATDDSNNGAGDYSAHGPYPTSWTLKDYSKNSATGDYARSTGEYVPVEPSSAAVVTDADESGFAWGDAALGAGAAFALALIAGGATALIRRRRIASPVT
jgi:hypothetical protein